MMNYILKYKSLFPIILFLIGQFGTIHIFANDISDKNKITVVGTVLDEMDNPIEGVKISIKGVDSGTLTDSRGKFSFKCYVNSTDKFLFYKEGYEINELTKLSDKKNIVKLKKDFMKSQKNIEIINDSKPQYSLGSSVYSISADEIAISHNYNLAGCLAGKIPGLYVRTTGGEPGNESYSMNIRGASTTSSHSPLVLIDGIIGNLGSVNPQDVESVTVMKDAAATVLYGMEGSSGIISVKTKRGNIGSTNITFNADYTIQEPICKPYMINSYEYASMINQSWMNDGFGNNYIYSDEQLDAYKNGINKDLYPNNNWYDTFLKSNVQTQNVHLGANGGGEYIQYYFGLGYKHQDGPFKTDSALKEYALNRFDILSNFDVKVNSYIKASMNIASRIANDVLPNSVDDTSARNFDNINSNIMSTIFNFAPNFYGPLTPDDQVVVSPTQTNSTYGMINKSGYDKQTNLDISANLCVDFDLSSLMKGLSTSAYAKYNTKSISNTFANTNYERWILDTSNIDELNFVRYGTTEEEPLQFKKNVSTSFRSEYGANINYKRSFGNNNVFGNAFFRRQYYNADNISGKLPIKRMTYGISAGYGYKELFFANFSASYDGSEKFMKNHRYGFFPAVDCALILSNMDFLKNNNVLTYFKIRSSYGVVGNDNFNTSNRFLYRDNFSTSGYPKVNFYGSMISESQFGNPNITWEKSHILDLGLELSLFNVIKFGIDYYHDNRTDILISDATTPSLNGVSSSSQALTNGGEVVNQGFEIQLGFDKLINKNLSVAINGHFDFNQNKIKKIGELPKTDDYAYRYTKTGFRISQLWGYAIDYSNGNGYYNSQNEIDESKLIYDVTQPRVGDFIYQDQNNDGIISDKDLVPIGQTSIPQIGFGLDMNIKWKKFNLCMLFQGLAKFGTFKSGIGYYETYNHGTFFSQHLKAWTQERYSNGEEIAAPALTASSSSSLRNNNYFYQNLSFVRLKNLELGYTIQLKKNSFCQYIRPYISGTNLLTFDHMKNNDIDVESGNVSSFPICRYYNLGINVTF